MIKQVSIIACWLLVVGTGAFLRFDHLSKRPFHADEATGARITASRMESGDYRFDPVHYHGPILSGLAIPIARFRGEDGWREFTKLTPRILTAACGTLLLLVPLLWRKRFGDGPVLAAAAFLATSPLLVYYSRMFIHEPLLVLFGMLALVSLTRAPRFGIAGLLIGLMFATKETFAISILAWSGAAAVLAWENRRRLDPSRWRDYRTPVAVSLLAAALTSGFFYTDGFQKPAGAIDAIRTFFVYETVGGHDKPFGYYFDLLALPSKSAGFWWYGTPVLLLALLAFASTFRHHPDAEKGRSTVRFLGYAAAGHFLIYSMIGYKTPWLACLPWAHVCVLAGTAFIGFSGRPRRIKGTLAALALVSLASQFTQARRATGRLASDERNPFAYVPTRGDVERIGPWLRELEKVAPGGTLEPVAVIGRDYWPLPWYLRDFEQTGYWNEAPDNLASFPLVFAMPDESEDVANLLAGSHTPLPRGLRAGAPMLLLVRNDIWKRWMEK